MLTKPEQFQKAILQQFGDPSCEDGSALASRSAWKKSFQNSISIEPLALDTLQQETRIEKHWLPF